LKSNLGDYARFGKRPPKKSTAANRTKYFHLDLHFFWQLVRDGMLAIVKVDTQEQWADFLTKGINCESFERIRKLVQGW
jgi:hypothetical protein